MEAFALEPSCEEVHVAACSPSQTSTTCEHMVALEIHYSVVSIQSNLRAGTTCLLAASLNYASVFRLLGVNKQDKKYYWKACQRDSPFLASPRKVQLSLAIMDLGISFWLLCCIQLHCFYDHQSRMVMLGAFDQEPTVQKCAIVAAKLLPSSAKLLYYINI
eukprot:654062-Amphidinium_carterae.2